MVGFRVVLFAAFSAACVVCDNHTAAEDLVLADTPESLAILGEILTNTSSVVGGSAQFYCEVIGTQALGETLRFAKIDPVTGDPTLISTDNIVVDSSKHVITDRYRITINSITWTDEGEYQCILGVNTPETAYLIVSDPPTNADLYWPGGLDYTQKDVKANLTCEADNSRPPASFRWIRGETEITGISINPKVSVDSNGYGRGMSVLELTPTASDEGVVYTCHAAVPGQNSAVVENISVSFSGVSHVMASVCLVLTSLLVTIST